MSDVPEPVPSSEALETIRALEADAHRKKRRIRLVLFVVLPAVAIAVGVGWWQVSERAAARDIQLAWDKATACLVGAPLGEGQRASLRVRAIQLAAAVAELGKPEDRRWPSRCADHVAALNQALRQHGRDKDGDEGLAQQSEQLALRLRKVRVMDDLSADVDGLFDAAQAMSLTAGAASIADPPPDPTQALDLDQLPESARIAEQQFTVDKLSTTPMVGVELHVLVYDRRLDDTPRLCTFAPSGQDRCRKLDKLAGKDGLLLGATVEPGASPLVFVGHDGEGGIYRGDTQEKITAMRASSAYVAKSGYVAITSLPLDPMDGRFELVQQAKPATELERATVEPQQFEPKATQIHRKRILWDQLLVQTFDEDAPDASPVLQVRALPTDQATSDFADIAPLNWINARITGCRSADTTIARIGDSRGFLTFRSEGRWTTPVPAESFPPAFSCDKGEAVFTDAFGSQQRCTPAGCKRSDGVAPHFKPFEQRTGALADVGGRILALALTEGRGGLRLRHAPGNNLTQAGQHQVLFDDLIKDGKVQLDSTVLGMALLGRGRFAILLLSTPAGLYALRFDAQGKPVPATITHQ